MSVDGAIGSSCPEPILWPWPCAVRRTGGIHELGSGDQILQGDLSASGFDAWWGRVIDTCRDGDTERHVTCGGIHLRLEGRDAESPEAYRLSITSSSIHIAAPTREGHFRGFTTLRQLLRQYGPSGYLPCMDIRDEPVFPERGLMWDISRNRVPTLAALYRLVDLMVECKLNHLQLYTEHTFAYREHREVWKNASPLTAEDVDALSRYCGERHVRLVPNQNSFGHLRPWLKHPRYHHLAECLEEVDTEFGRQVEPFGLCPQEPRARLFLAGLYDELLPHFGGDLFNVGCDETVDLGKGRSAAVCEEKGVGRVYLDFLLQIDDLVRTRGRRMMFWADMMNRYPELIPELPGDAIPLVWDYEADAAFGPHLDRYLDAGLKPWVCPGTGTWNSLGGRLEQGLANMRRAARQGQYHGASGYLVTDWGDNGHWQPMVVSFPAVAAAGAYAWSSREPHRRDLVDAINVHIVSDGNGRMGDILYEMGNLYRLFHLQPFNASTLFHALYHFDQDLHMADAVYGEKDRAGFLRSLEAMNGLRSALSCAMPRCDDGSLCRNEVGMALSGMELACRIALARLDHQGAGVSGLPDPVRQDLGAAVGAFRDVFQATWLHRSRPGGWIDSIRPLELLHAACCSPERVGPAGVIS